MKQFLFLVIGLGPYIGLSNQRFTDYYNPKAENFSKKQCTKKPRRTVASAKKIPIDHIGSIEKELAKKLHAADINFDGKPDFFRKWKNGRLLSISYDANADAKVDFQYVFRSLPTAN